MIKLIRTVFMIVLILLLYIEPVKTQPVPIELMIGHNYGVVDLSFGSSLSQNSRLGLFHMNTIQFNYTDADRNSIILQDLLYVEIFKYLRIAGGTAYSNSGFNPTAGLQFIINRESFIFLCAPRVNIKSDPSYDIMTIIQYRQDINDKIELFSRFKMLNLFNSDGNIKSYQWIRLGLEVKGIQFGFAVNLDEYGPSPSVENNVGIFIRKEIY